MIQIRQIDHVVLRAIDLAAMLKFYCEVLRCPIEKVQPELGLWQLRAGHSLIDLVALEGKLGRLGGAAPGREAHNMDHLCLRVEPFDAAAICAYLREHGIEAGEVVQRYGAEGNGPSIYIRDPQGNTVELKGPSTD